MRHSLDELFGAGNARRGITALTLWGGFASTVFVPLIQLLIELFGWREFRNRREVGSVAGLVPTPYNTGESAREQGISKAGNARVRRVMIEAAWSWLRYQPESALSKWFNAKFAAGKRKKGIVALARKLLIAFWRVAETGVYPEGTVLKSTRQAKGA